MTTVLLLRAQMEKQPTQALGGHIASEDAVPGLRRHASDADKHAVARPLILQLFQMKHLWFGR